MAINVADNFSYKGGKPLDSRIQYNTVSDMVSTPIADLYDGCLAYSKDTKKNYQYDSNNTVDPTLGKWREFSSGGGGSTYTAGDGIDITNDVVSLIPTESGDMEEIVDELPTGGAIKVTGFTPIGTIISIFSETAPRNFLICDGSIYNKADYPELAYHLLHLTTHSQYEVDGDATKFKVPDLRGEFLRGTGTNSHTDQGSGAGVGEHQDGTEHINLALDFQRSGQIALYSSSRNNNSTLPASVNADSSVVSTDKNGWTSSYITAESWTASGNKSYTSRPTNTSVLYCIAVRDIYTNPMNDYSTSEKVVGTWIDGKPIYQKTVSTTISSVNDWTNMAHGISNISNCVNAFGTIVNAAGYWIIGGYRDSNTYSHILVDGTNAKVFLGNQSSFVNGTMYVTLQYTKTTD